MNASEWNLVLLGALWISAWVAALFFLRFWRATHDRLFAFFSAAFGLLGVNWISLAAIHWVPETQHRGFYVRLAAFGLIIFAVIDKNRKQATQPRRE